MVGTTENNPRLGYHQDNVVYYIDRRNMSQSSRWGASRGPNEAVLKQGDSGVSGLQAKVTPA